jgi:hypothetical protein
MGPVAPTEAAILAKLQAGGRLLFVFLRVVVPTLALRARHRDHHALLFFRHYPVSQDVGASAEHERNGRRGPFGKNDSTGQTGCKLKPVRS